MHEHPGYLRVQRKMSFLEKTFFCCTMLLCKISNMEVCQGIFHLLGLAIPRQGQTFLCHIQSSMKEFQNGRKSGYISSFKTCYTPAGGGFFFVILRRKNKIGKSIKESQRKTRKSKRNKEKQETRKSKKNKEKQENGKRK